MILFITRKYPPAVGGMEKLSYEMTQAVGRIVPSHVIAWRGPRWGWPMFTAFAFFAGLWACLTAPVRFIHMSDPVIAPLGLLLSKLTGRRWGLTAHGLDILYPNRLYQATVIPCVRRADAVIAISQAAREACLSKGIAPERCVMIPVGLEIPPHEPDVYLARERLRIGRGLELAHHRVLLTVGRLVPRKGVAWFLSAVLPRLAVAYPDVLYLIAGDGPARPSIRQMIRQGKLQDRVALMSHVSDETLADLYACATLFVMPNVPVPGDMEGFGIVAIEAASRGVPVVASRLEGISDALADGENGVLLPPEDADAWVSAIAKLLSDDAARADLGARAREFTQARYRWDGLARRYVEVFGLAVPEERTEWDAAYLHVRRGARRRLKRLRAFDIPRDALILDYGCGDGINTRLLAQLGRRRVVSMDNSLRLLRAGSPPRPVAADAHRTPFADGAFDVVLVDGVLHHLDAERALREIARVLRPGGMLCIVEPAGSWLRSALDRMTFSPLGPLWSELRHRRTSLAGEWDTYQAWLQMEHGLPQMTERAGLEIRSLRRTPLNQILTAIRL
jgi:glycosyltransferase involved in cell wall biosynthesis/ubiquinone/menaquinone biosynthesis C-methylase UbiE